jgi:hypothetical protein
MGGFGPPYFSFLGCCLYHSTTCRYWLGIRESNPEAYGLNVVRVPVSPIPKWSVELDLNQLDSLECRFYGPVQPSHSAVYRHINKLAGGAGFEPADDALLRRLIVFETIPIRPLRQPPAYDSLVQRKRVELFIYRLSDGGSTAELPLDGRL